MAWSSASRAAIRAFLARLAASGQLPVFDGGGDAEVLAGERLVPLGRFLLLHGGQCRVRVRKLPGGGVARRQAAVHGRPRFQDLLTHRIPHLDEVVDGRLDVAGQGVHGALPGVVGQGEARIPRGEGRELLEQFSGFQAPALTHEGVDLRHLNPGEKRHRTGLEGEASRLPQPPIALLRGRSPVESDQQRLDLQKLPVVGVGRRELGETVPGRV